MSDAAIDALGELAAKLRDVPDALRAAMPHLASEVDDYLRECAARGVDPDGNPWPVTELGRKPKITGTTRAVVAHGSHIYVRFTGHDAMHSRGTARGGKLRRLVPAGPIPPALAKRMAAIVKAELDRAVAP